MPRPSFFVAPDATRVDSRDPARASRQVKPAAVDFIFYPSGRQDDRARPSSLFLAVHIPTAETPSPLPTIFTHNQPIGKYSHSKHRSDGQSHQLQHLASIQDAVLQKRHPSGGQRVANHASSHAHRHPRAKEVEITSGGLFTLFLNHSGPI